jgi:hypothetical protein
MIQIHDRHMSEWGPTVTEITAEGRRTFYSQEEYHAHQRQQSEAMWNRWTQSERIRWWIFRMIFGYNRTPVYGAFHSLIGIPGWIPGTRIPFF